MAKKRCMKCAEKIEWSAVKCRFCSSDQPVSEGNEPTSALNKVILGLGVALLLILGIIFFGPRDEQAAAVFACDEQVFMNGSAYYKLSPQERMDCRARAMREHP